MLLRILEEYMGVVIFDDERNDFAISDYILDSLAFIKFVIAIETELGIELSDDFLLYDILNSAKGFTEKLDFFMTSLQNNKSMPISAN
jgi:acyl carrier protein